MMFRLAPRCFDGRHDMPATTLRMMLFDIYSLRYAMPPFSLMPRLFDAADIIDVASPLFQIRRHAAAA